MRFFSETFAYGYFIARSLYHVDWEGNKSLSTVRASDRMNLLHDSLRDISIVS